MAESGSALSSPGPRADERRNGRGRRRRRRRIVRLALGTLVLLLVAAAASLAYDAVRAKDVLELARGDVRSLQGQVESGDGAGASVTLVRLQGRSHTAYAHTHGPLWGVAAVLPWIGADVRAVRMVSGVVDSLATDSLPALMQASAVVDPLALAPVAGRVNLAPIAEVAPQVVAADAAVQEARAQLARIDTNALLGLVAQPVAALRTQVDEVGKTTATAARAAELVPSMMGADGPRDYLLLVQNNAEPRATGGIPGSIVHLRADGGAVQVVEQRSGGSLSGLAASALPLTAEEDAIFGPLLGTDMRDVTFTPDFPRSAALAREIWIQRVGGTVDGVLSVDPGALARLLGATGPVTTAGGVQITSANAVELLLNTVYKDIAKPAAQDAFFTATSAAVFSAVVSGQGHASAVIDALAQSAREGRVMIWSAHEEEQRRLAGTVLSGELRGVVGSSAVVGVYLNDGTEAKMGYYLDLKVTGTATECLADGSQLIHVSATLTSTAPADAAKLPVYLTGGGAVVPRGQTRTNVLIYAPAGGGIESSRVNSAPGSLFAQTHDGLSVGALTITLEPGQTSTVELDVRSGPRQTGDPVIRLTPTAHSSGPVVVASAC
ncbi:MAG: DUF4012 domain-containing protein [Cellulomonas sp.]|nr:DUF4012 domain-containing protein [Cellulomonas sp.]